MNTLLNYKNILAVTFLLIVVTIAMFVLQRPSEVLGSVLPGAEYTSTSTAPSAALGATISTSRLIKAGYGSLGSLIITGANTGIINFYDATTTNVNQRTGQKATSTILLASFPASTAAGTYTLDVTYSQGLWVQIDGTAATSTITYR